MLSGGLIEKIGTVEAGGRITGDLIIEGDLTVEGSATHVYDQEVQGGMVIDATDTEALLIRKASDGGDVFTIDSSSEIIQVNSHNGSSKGLKLGTTLVTATGAELNILDGATLSTAELNYVDGVTSAIQTQIDAKAPIASPTFTGTITIGSAEISEAELEVLDGLTVTTSELNTLDGITATVTELNYLDITTLGTLEASKVLTADSSGNINFNNGNMTNVDIDSGDISGTDITVGSSKTLDVSGGTLTLADNQISGNKIDGGTISSFTSTGIDDNASSNALTIDSSQNLALTSGILTVYSEINTGAGNRDIHLNPHGTGEVSVTATLDATAIKINGTLISSTATELNLLDGITAIKDEDDMTSDSATSLATQQSIKAYVDAVTTSLNLQDLDFSADSGGALNIDLDTESLSLSGGTGVATVGSGNTVTFNTVDSEIVHDNLSGFVANEHIDHSGVTLTAGDGLTGGGDITANRSFAVGAGTGITVNANDIQTNDSEIVHDSLSGFVANEHIDHSSVTLTAGTGLSGGGDLTTSRSFSVDASQTQITEVGTLTALQVDNININGNAITSTDTNGDISLTPHGTGEVNISKVDIDSGTLDSISSFTASGDLDIGSHDFRASTLTADSLTSGRVVFAGTNGVLSDDGDMTFSSDTLTVTNLVIGGTLTTAGAVEISSTTLNVEDPLILLNKYDSQPTNNSFDAGFIIKRGSGDSTPANVGFIFDESANQFALIDTTEDGTTAGNVSITDYENLRIGALTADDASTLASGTTIGNLTLANGSITDSGGSISLGDDNLVTTGRVELAELKSSSTGAGFDIKLLDNNSEALDIAEDTNLYMRFDTSNSNEKIEFGKPVFFGTNVTSVDFNSRSMTNVNIDSGDISGTNISGGTGAFTTLTASGDVNFDSNTLFVDASENKVGIGTNSPQQPMHIHQASSGSTSYLQITQDGTGATGSDGLLIGVNANEQAIIYNQENTDLIFYTNTAERIRIANNGPITMAENVSIDAGRTLTTKGDVTLKDESGAENRFLFDVGNAGDNPKFIVYNNDGSTEDFKIDNGTITSVSGATFGGTITQTVSSGTNDLIMKGDSNKTITLSQADGTMDAQVEGNSSNLLLTTRRATPIVFAINNSEKMRLDSSGNLGIGTTSPTTLLHVKNATNNDAPIRVQGGTSTETFDFQVKGVASPAHYSAGIYSMESANSGLAFYTKDSSGNSQERLSIDGAGTASFGGNISTSGNIEHDGTLTTDITTNNTGHDFRLHADNTFVNSIDNFFDGASAGSSFIRFKVASGANSQATVLNMKGDGLSYFSGKLGVNTSPSYALDVEIDEDTWAQRLKNLHGNAYGLFINRSGGSGSANTDRKYMQCEDDSAVRLIIYSNGNVVNANNSYGSTSDKRIKNSIADASSQWDDIKALKIRKFKKNEAGENAPYHIGVIAQELETAGMNGLIDESPAMEDQIRNNKDIKKGDSVKSVKTSVLYMKGLKALQEAMIKIETLESKVTELEKRCNCE